jgi:hypothetical protein
MPTSLDEVASIVRNHEALTCEVKTIPLLAGLTLDGISCPGVAVYNQRHKPAVPPMVRMCCRRLTDARAHCTDVVHAA